MEKNLMRTLIIGSNRVYCFMLKDFLEERGLITAVVLSYKEGIDKLFYEKPDLTVIELTSQELSPALINRIKSSQHFELVNVKKYRQLKEEIKPVLILEETNQINTLFHFLDSHLSSLIKQETESISDNTEEDGNLESVSYPILLANLYRDKRTGILEINSSDKLRVYLVEGIPVFAEGGDVETALGRMLLDSGKVSEVNYEKALEVATKNKQRLGEVLVGMGLISPHELNSFLEVQVREKIIRGFSCTQGTYGFTTESDFKDRMVAYQINLPQILYDGLKRCIDVESIEKTFFKKEKNPSIELTPDLKAQTNTIGIGPKEQRFIQLLKEKGDINDIVKTSRLEKGETFKLLYFLYLLGFLKVSGISFPEIKIPASKKPTEKKEAAGKYENEEIETRAEDIIILEEEIAEIGSDHLNKDSDMAEEKPGASLVHGPAIDLDKKRKKQIEIELGSPSKEINDEAKVLKPIDSTAREIHDIKKKPRREIEIKFGSSNEESAKNKIEQINDPAAHQTEEEKKKKKQVIIDEILNLYFSLPGKNQYELLGITKEATKEEIKSSYFSLVKKFHPDANPDFKKDIREKAEEIFTKITSAYETLSDDQKRKEYDSQDEVEKVKSQVKIIYDAELAYKDGDSFLKQRKHREAEEKFRQAVNLNPAEAAYLGALAWAKFLGETDKDRVLNEVKKQFEKAISMNPNVAENYFYLGNIYKHIDDAQKAETNFLKAVQHNPDFIEAKRELRLLQQRKSESNIKDKKREKKFWSSLFKK
jgi:curved DNA-binding protein CbpA